jgi:predicted Zn-ribbon and HTH transcriptional regulator
MRLCSGDSGVIAENMNSVTCGNAEPRCTCPYCGKSFNFSDADFTEETADGQKYNCRCSKCGYSWNSQKEIPKRCPSCGSYHWEEAKVILDCKRCGYAWEARGNMNPSRCPKCRSMQWKTPPSPKQIARPVVSDAVKKEYKRRFTEAFERCSRGESVYDVCVELDVAIIEMLIALKSRKGSV